MKPSPKHNDYAADHKFFAKFINFSIIINSQLDLDKILSLGSDNITEIMSALGCHIMLFENIKDELSLSTGAQTGSTELPKNVDEIVNKHYDINKVDQAILKKPMIINDVNKDSRIIKHLVDLIGHKSLLRVPIISGNEVIGVIIVYSKEYNYFTEDIVRNLTLLSNQMGIAINNARIIKQLENEKKLMNKLNEKEKELDQVNYLLKLEEQIKQNEKFAVVGKMAAGLAHEIRNPMTSIKGFLQLIYSKTEDATNKKYLAVVLDDLERICSLVSNFLMLSKPSAPKFDTYQTSDVINEVLEIMKSDALENDITINENLQCNLPEIYIDKEQFKQVIINIIRNSIEAIRGKGEISISNLLLEEGMVRTVIQDNGPGIDEEVQSKIFDPFYTTKDEGTGLGLSVSYQIVENMHGRIFIHSEKNNGTITFIDMPVKISKRKSKAVT